MAARQAVLLDTSVLVNFAAIRRLDLLASHPRYSFFITDHVRSEILEDYEEQLGAVDTAVENGTLVELVSESPDELNEFAALVGERRLGTGECSAIAVAKRRSLLLAIDDKRARTTARSHGVHLLSTEAVMVSLIREDALTVEQADAIKAEWERNHRFKLGFSSFAEKL